MNETRLKFDEEDADAADGRGERQESERSPNYPMISLDAAIERAKKLHAVVGTAPTLASVAIQHLGFSLKSSGGRRTISDLVKFGLCNDSGRGDDRRVEITPLALELLLSDPGSGVFKAAAKEAAMCPNIHKRMVGLWGSHPPPRDAALRSLVEKENFTEAGAAEFLRQYIATMAFAGWLPATPASPASPTEAGTKATPMTQLSPPSAEEQYVAPRRESAAALPPTTNNSKGHSMQSATREDVFSLDEGQAKVQWPDPMSVASFEDFKAWLELVIRKVGRNVKDRRAIETPHE